ncbi:ribosomal-processing cysteine protease Prp [Pseudalkalibacillus berkeleyi]|uniref:Ribosomal processing cysteine protease Prp n=1 Tax=Pseudalkalibacillus berkeleyi TaxID=1069813 RepID=A0ABS9GZA9_9BACL|nr:ribosomal-processing cysteine protease Prp [Pseudalkalibacillus berkeleyi]MCF6138088.1 ribosomal-processing cysteine protease Prp [Pseudalkalibacillus berkeleyi]
MLTVNIHRDQHNIVSFSISGHAESGPYGHDLVCAAVTAVSFGSVNAIEELCQVEPEVETRENGGYLLFKTPSSVNEETSKKMQLLLEGMLVSLRTIERDYGKYIKIEVLGGASHA